MCKPEDVTNDVQSVPDVRARCGSLADGTWVMGLTLGPDHPTRSKRPSTRFHFVLDNSGSMGRNSQHAKDCFSDLVGFASGPCSLVAFDSSATLLGENFQSPAQFRAAALPRQGGTNITAGLEAAVEVVRRHEAKEADSGGERTHHVLVLLSDGAHMVGPRPEERLPGLGAELRAGFPMLRLSVVVVGVTCSSNTSMGMLMKQGLETVALPALEPIYFASTPTAMDGVLSQMREGLASLRGSVVHVQAPSGCMFVRAVGEAGVPSVDVLAEAHEQALLCLGQDAPVEVEVDGAIVQCIPCPREPADFDIELASSALQQLVDAVRVRRVAIGAAAVRPALEQLRLWISALEARAAEQLSATSGVKLCLAKATPAERLAQHKALRRSTQSAKELFNQLAEIEAHTANDSASQAAFLTGARSKYGAKALLRASAHADGVTDPALRLRELVADIASIAPEMRQALRQDFCEKLAALESDALARLHDQLVSALPESVPRSAVRSLCSGAVTAETLEDDAALAHLVDSGVAVEPLLKATGRLRQSYLSLYSAWEQLSDWCNPASQIADCSNEYQLLMCLGALGYPISVQRRAATQMDPYAMDVTRVRASLADTASLSTALHSDQSIVPPEGGVPVQDLLVLVDPDVPRASRLAVSSLLLREAYTSVVLCRDLHMFTGNKMRVALHAHSLLAAVQPPAATPCKEDLEAQMRRQYLGRAFQCAECRFGPIDHFACGDLEAHHGEDVGGATISNACPRCGWFSGSLSDWPKWDGTVPKEALSHSVSQAAPGGMTAASVEVALRICYSARALWQPGPDGEARALCAKLANWEPLTAADGVDHPVQALLALAVADDLPEPALGLVPILTLLNDVCARRARGELRQDAGTDENAVLAAARKRVAAFLGVTAASAPQARPLEESEPSREAVQESCCADYDLDCAAFDFKEWVRDVLQPWTPALLFVKRLRASLGTRKGGWPQLAKDMEAGPQAYADLVHILQKPAGSKESLRALIGVESPSDAPRVLATIAAQAFLHQSSQLRRTVAAGGALREPLGDVRDSDTLRALCVELRMATYEERVAAKMRQWGQLGASLTRQRAMAADLDQYAHMCGSHVHGLDGPTFWGLWNAAVGEKAKEFLSKANQGFVAKYGARAGH
mmetsp:Transcript_123085/g.359351  ORF Transcript_123085/g.359351 Transcript_123085/m.359351 type:complete len:1144 (+) Transcript_123085:57-3488(+)